MGITAILANNNVQKEPKTDGKDAAEGEIDEATEQLVEKIENFEMNSMPPNLKLAEMHRDCNKIGQAPDYRSIRSVISI